MRPFFTSEASTASPRVTNAKLYTIICAKRFINYKFAKGCKAELSQRVVLREVETPSGELERALAIDPGYEEARTYLNQLPASK